MLNPSNRTARVYAEAMIDIGRQQGLLARIAEELTDLAKLYAENRDFRAFFTSPRLDPERKFAVVRELFGEQACKPVLGLLHVLIRKGRELLLDNVAGQFLRFKDEAEGLLHVHVRTARSLSPDQLDEIRRKVEGSSGKAVRVHESVEPELIGGTIVRVRDSVIDGSLRRKLKALRKRLVAKERIFD